MVSAPNSAPEWKLEETITTVSPLQACEDPFSPREPIFYGDFSFNTGSKTDLSAVDYLIFVGMLVMSTAIGTFVTWQNRRSLGITEFLLAGRTMNTIPVALSLFASFMSAITMIGVPEEIYRFSTVYAWIGLAYIAVCACAAEIYIPVFYQLKITSVYEYLERRFNGTVRKIASAFFITQMTIYLSIVLLVPSFVVEQVTGINLHFIMLAVTLVAMLYTALGGVKAVIYTDSYQCIMMVGGYFIVLLWAQYHVLSWGDVVDSARRTNRLVFSDFQTRLTVRHSVWSIVFGGFVTWISLYGCNQAQVQRCLTCRQLSVAKMALWLNAIGLNVFLVIGCLIGLYMSAFYENCDPYTSKLVKEPATILPLFVMDIANHKAGLPGIFFTAIFSGTLSTISSGLAAIASAILEDFFRTIKNAHIREDNARIISQATSIIFGFICYEVSHTLLDKQDLFEIALSIHGGLASPVLGVFSLGMFFPWANQTGAIWGLIASFVFNFLVIIMRFFSKVPVPSTALMCVSNCNFTAVSVKSEMLKVTPAASTEQISTNLLLTMSYLWMSVFAVVICILVGMFVSFLTGFDDPTEKDPRLIVPLADVVFPFYYLPEDILEQLRFGVDHIDKWQIYTPGKCGTEISARTVTSIRTITSIRSRY